MREYEIPGTWELLSDPVWDIIKLLVKVEYLSYRKKIDIEYNNIKIKLF